MTQTATSDLPQAWGTTSEGEFTRLGTLFAFGMGAFAVFITFPVGIIGIALSCMGLDRIKRRDPSAQKFLIWSWILFVPGTVIGVPLTLLFLASLLRSVLT